MESVQDTPAKRRKMENGHVAGGYNSQDDSGDDLVRDYQDFETVETVPLPPRVPHDFAQDTYSLTTPTQHVTQPTQIINRTPTKSGTKSTVQVAATSPVRSPILPIRAPVPPPQLRNLMAPPGTAYRAPHGIKPPPENKPVIHITSDSEGPTYIGDSSDEDQTDRNNIKPSTFTTTAQNHKTSFGRKEETGKPQKATNAEQDPIMRLQSITSKFAYDPTEAAKKRPGLQGSVYDSRNRDETVRTSRIAGTAQKRDADVMASSYGGFNRPAKIQRQNGPAKAIPINNISLEQITDVDLRNKVLRMRNILPHKEIAELYVTLIAKKGREDDALDCLSAKDEIDLTNDVDELSSDPPAKLKPAAKQQIKAPRKTIQDKWAPSQATVQRKAEQKPASSPMKEEPKPRRRLVRGRKGGTRTPTPEPVAKPEPIPKLVLKRAALSITSDSEGDSALGSDVEVETILDTELLKFFNECSIADLSDLAEINDELSILLISNRPFKDLAQVRHVSNTKKPSRAKNPPKPIGEKIVDKCEEMWAGYAAVDELVKTVERLGKPVAEAMKKWGVDVFGKSAGGELDILNVKLNEMKTMEGTNNDLMKDSGLGTPISSKNLSADENSDTEVKENLARKADAFFPQPAKMAKGVELKEYQVVGINWLSLLFDKGLSCILADDMGLGKTCQVVAFLAHLFEKGEKGPHLIVVPASTLENWLREFSLFCPSLEVMPYYGEF